MSERPVKRKVEFIESYWTGGPHGSDYFWNDNHGELIRCKDCKYGDSVKNAKGEPMIECALLYEGWLKEPEWFCADGERKENV